MVRVSRILVCEREDGSRRRVGQLLSVEKRREEESG